MSVVFLINESDHKKYCNLEDESCSYLKEFQSDHSKFYGGLQNFNQPSPRKQNFRILREGNSIILNL